MLLPLADHTSRSAQAFRLVNREGETLARLLTFSCNVLTCSIKLLNQFAVGPTLATQHVECVHSPNLGLISACHCFGK